jgi:hypothetical protein
MRAAVKEPVINEIPEKGAVGAAGLAPGGLQGKNIPLILQQVNLRSKVNNAKVLD